MNRILYVVLLIVVVVGGVMLWKQYHPSSSFGDGSINTRETASDTPADKGMASGTTTDLDNGPATEARPTPSRSDAPGTINGDKVGSGAATNQPPAGQYAPQTSQAPLTATPNGALPVRDTISPNPPNGAVFAATGKYQWYRQGNITWRVDSGSGNTCIAFATMEEWQKPIVYTNGCRNVA